MHGIAENVHKARLVLKQNKNVMAQLRQFYEKVPKARGFPKSLVDNCKEEIEKFADHLQGIENDIEIQLLRLETFLSLLADRKALVL